MIEFEEVYEIVKKELSEKRFAHSVNVMNRCIEFASIYGEDIEKAKLVGIAHDIAKEISKEKRIMVAEEYNVKLDDFEKKYTSLIHAKLGAKICRVRFGFTEDMCKAIEAHTTALPNMTNLQKILYLSDFSEASRTFKEAIEAYEIGKKNLDEGYFYALVNKLKFMIDDNSPIHHNSIDAYNDYLL